MQTSSLKLALSRIAAGTLGGFTMGLLMGIFDSIGTANALTFGLVCAFAGLLAGGAGHLLFSGSRPAGAIRSIVNFAIVGAVFFLTMSLVTPEVLSEIMDINAPLASLIGGLVGGAAGGAMIVILMGGYSGAIQQN